MPDPQPWWDQRNTKYYTVDIEIDPEYIEGILPEMTADVELILDRLDNILQVPIAAVFSEGDETFCWKVTGRSKRTKVPVKVGRSNETHVEILEGILEGDTVLLVPPEGVVDTGEAKKVRPEAAAPPGNGGG